MNSIKICVYIVLGYQTPLKGEKYPYIDLNVTCVDNVLLVNKTPH